MESEDKGGAFAPTPLGNFVGSRGADEASRASAETLPPRHPDGRFAPRDEAPRDEAPPEESQRSERPREDQARPDQPRPASPGSSETDHVPLAALKGERERRQAAERALAAMQAQLEQARQQPAMTPQRLVEEMWKHPDGPEAFISSFVAQQSRAEEEARLKERLALSESYAKRAFADYDQMTAAFTQAVEAQARALGRPASETPLADMLRRHPDPAAFAYETGKRALMLAKIGDDPEAFINAEVERRLAQRSAQQSASETVSASPMPSSLASVRSTGGRSPPPYDGPPPLDAIIGPRRQRR